MLKDLFSRHGIAFGFAGEAYSFYSSVQGPIILKHAATFTSEAKMKMEFTQPDPGQFVFDEADSLVSKCQEAGISLHGHCLVWHMQYPYWLDPALSAECESGRYALLAEHVRMVTSHYAPVCTSLDVVNELQPAVEANCGGFGYYLGIDAGRFAFTEARKYAGSCKLFYNSFFNSDKDADYAISLLDVCDGIGIQTHLSVGVDYTAFFERVGQIVAACKAAGKLVRFSEVSVRDPSDNQGLIANLHVLIAKKAIEFDVDGFTLWGVKYPAWDGRHLYHDRGGLPTKAFWGVVYILTSSY